MEKFFNVIGKILVALCIVLVLAILIASIVLIIVAIQQGVSPDVILKQWLELLGWVNKPTETVVSLNGV